MSCSRSHHVDVVWACRCPVPAEEAVEEVDEDVYIPHREISLARLPTTNDEDEDEPPRRVVGHGRGQLGPSLCSRQKPLRLRG